MARISWQHRSLFCSLYVWTDDDHHWIMEDSAWSIPRSWQFHHHWTRCPAAHLSTRHRRGGGYVTAEICVRALGSLKVKEILWDALYIFVYTISAPNGQRQDLSNTTRFQCLRPKSSQDSKVMLYKQNYRNLWDGCGNALQVSLHALFAVTKMPTTLCNNPIKCHGSYALQLDLCTAWCGSLGNPRNSWPLSQKGSNRQSRQSLEADQTWGTPWNPPQKRSFLLENHQIFKPWSGTRGIQLDFQWMAIFEDVHMVWDGHFLISHIKNCHFGRVKPTLSDTYRTFYRYGSARFKPNTKPRFQDQSCILRSFTWTKSLVNLSCPIMRIRRTNGGFQSMGVLP